jgi:ATP-dependent Clp protease protease subunit
LKEIPLDAAYNDKPYNLDIIKDGNTIAGYYVLTDIRPSVVDEIRRYYYYHPELNKLIIEIHSPGGSVMDAWRIIGLLEEMRSREIVIQTVCNGLAASAGTILFIAGDIGKRYISPNAEVMVHKVWQFSMFSIADPDSSEDKTDTLKHFQANINSFFAKRTNLTPEILNDRTYKKMWWMTGAEAVKHGIADQLVGE